MTEIVRDPHVRILCPGSLFPIHPAHVQHVNALNRAYDAMQRDEDDESPADQQAIYDAVEDEGSYMRLHVGSVFVMVGGRRLHVHTAYWHCRTCGHTIAATTEVNS